VDLYPDISKLTQGLWIPDSRYAASGMTRGNDPRFDFKAMPPKSVIASQRVGAKRRPTTGSAKQSICRVTKEDGLLRRFAPRNDVDPSRTSAFSRRNAPELFNQRVPRNREGAGDPQERAQGKPGAPGTRSLACSKKTRELVTTGIRKTSGLPCAMVLTVSFALSLVTGLCCHHRRAENFCAT
jgi:hypothetical protein